MPIRKITVQGSLPGKLFQCLFSWSEKIDVPSISFSWQVPLIHFPRSFSEARCRESGDGECIIQRSRLMPRSKATLVSRFVLLSSLPSPLKRGTAPSTNVQLNKRMTRKNEGGTNRVCIGWCVAAAALPLKEWLGSTLSRERESLNTNRLRARNAINDYFGELDELAEQMRELYLSYFQQRGRRNERRK